MVDLKSKIQSFDSKAKNVGLLDHEIQERLSLLIELEGLEHLKRLYIIQKEKVKWAIEGDENTKFFHGMLNNKF